MCGDEPIERATTSAFAVAGQPSGSHGNPILHAYRVVSSLNGPAPKGLALFDAINLPVFVDAVKTITPAKALFSAVGAVAGPNLTDAEKIMAVVCHIWDLKKSGLTHSQTLQALDILLAINTNLPFLADKATVLMLEAAEAALKHYGSANYFTDQYENMASILYKTGDQYKERLKAESAPSFCEPVTL